MSTPPTNDRALPVRYKPDSTWTEGAKEDHRCHSQRLKAALNARTDGLRLSNPPPPFGGALASDMEGFWKWIEAVRIARLRQFLNYACISIARRMLGRCLAMLRQTPISPPLMETELIAPATRRSNYSSEIGMG